MANDRIQVSIRVLDMPLVKDLIRALKSVVRYLPARRREAYRRRIARILAKHKPKGPKVPP